MRSRRTAVLAAAGSIACVFAALPAEPALAVNPPALSTAAAPVGSRPSAPPTYDDFLGANGGSTGSEQCAVTMTARKGAWACPNTTPESAADAARKAQVAYGKATVSDADIAAFTAGANTSLAATRSTGAALVALATQVNCNLYGCWTRIDSAHAEYGGTGTYGWGSTTLGDATLYFKVTLTGFHVTTYPVNFSAQRAFKNTVLSTEKLQWTTTATAGKSMSPRLFNTYSGCGTKAGGTSCQWPSPGVDHYINTVSTLTVAGQATWSDTSSAYPGSWSMWGKSIKVYKNGTVNNLFDCYTCLPTSPAGGTFRI